jgi:hypothetical protein
LAQRISKGVLGMNITEAQARVDALAKRLQEKGVKNARAEIEIHSHVQPNVFLWGDEIDGKGGSLKGFYRVESPDAGFERAYEFIDALPSAEEIAQRAFMRQLGELIDKGRDLGIDLDFINPLSETMRRLSENVITDRSKEDAE